jgi:hypothetical protein
MLAIVATPAPAVIAYAFLSGIWEIFELLLLLLVQTNYTLNAAQTATTKENTRGNQQNPRLKYNAVKSKYLIKES